MNEKFDIKECFTQFEQRKHRNSCIKELRYKNIKDLLLSGKDCDYILKYCGVQQKTLDFYYKAIRIELLRIYSLDEIYNIIRCKDFFPITRNVTSKYYKKFGKQLKDLIFEELDNGSLKQEIIEKYNCSEHSYGLFEKLYLMERKGEEF